MARKKLNSSFPTFDELLIPTIQALQQLGGSGTNEEINNKVYEIAKIPNDILEIPHGENGTMSEVDYRLVWSKTYLKKFGLLENSARGIWALSQPDIDINTVDPDQIKRSVREQTRPTDNSTREEQEKQAEKEVEHEVEASENWKQKLLNTFYNISASAFERLAQRVLRESGFFQVEVTGKSGDGGIDGKGIVRISGFLSFHVIFQCKRYRSSITPDKIRDFRGAMQGRADKGLFITTGTFTREAIKEATRDGAPPIDLIDGELLCDKLKELKLGVETKLTETVQIKTDWFSNL
jgi:restriction system protein